MGDDYSLDPASHRAGKILRVSICGYFGFGNLGDEAILVASILKNTYQGKKVMAMINPRAFEDYRKWLDSEGLSDRVFLFNRWNPLDIFRAILSSDALILGGGGLLQDETSFRSLLYYFGVSLLGKLLKRKLFIERQTIGPLKRGISKTLVKWLLRMADKVSLRDRESLKIAREMGVEAELEEDWTLESEFAKWLRLEQTAEIKNLSYPIIWILRSWNLPRESFEILRETIMGFKPYSEFLAFQKEDLRMYSDLGLKPEEVFVYTDGPLKLREVIRKLQDAELIVSMRLHGLIFAYLLSKKAIGLSYSPKVSWFAEDKGIDYVEIHETEELRKLKDLITKKIEML